MDPRRVLTFRAVAHERSFSAAARALSLTQPAVSQQVAALEREVGAQLLDRGQMELTPAGAVLLAHADAIAERFALAPAQLTELVAPGRLRWGTFSRALASLVPRAIARIDGDVQLEEGGTEVLAERVARGALHLAVGFQDVAQPRREHEGCERRDLMREPFYVALWAGHPLAAREEVPIAALADEPWVAASGDNLIARTCRAAGFEMRLFTISRDPIANRALVAAGLAVTLVPRLLAADFAGVELRPVAGAGPQRDVYVLLPPGGRPPLADAAFAALAEVASELG